MRPSRCSFGTHRERLLDGLSVPQSRHGDWNLENWVPLGIRDPPRSGTLSRELSFAL